MHPLPPPSQLFWSNSTFAAANFDPEKVVLADFKKGGERSGKFLIDAAEARECHRDFTPVPNRGEIGLRTRRRPAVVVEASAHNLMMQTAGAAYQHALAAAAMEANLAYVAGHGWSLSQTQMLHQKQLQQQQVPQQNAVGVQSTAERPAAGSVHAASTGAANGAAAATAAAVVATPVAAIGAAPAAAAAAAAA